MKNLYLIKPLPLGTISPHIYGHFSEHIGGVFYDGIYVGEDSPIPNIKGFRKALVDAFKAINPPVLRWPGGCFAEVYDWRDGIGPKDQRPTRLNWWTPHDKRFEPNLVGTHEFVEFCRLVGAEPYFAANITSTTPLDIRDWIDYCNSPKGTTTYAKLREQNGSPEPLDVKYWGVGNECWGGGGNMDPETYAHEFRKYAAIMRNSAPGLQLIGCGPNGNDWMWTEKFLRVFHTSEHSMSGYSVHYYCGRSGDAVNFSNDNYYHLLAKAGFMENIIQRNWNLISGWGKQAQCPLFVDEWGCWHPDGSGPSKGYNLFEQQSTMRDALVTALTLNIFNNHCDKVKMANVAQLVNNLHCLFLAGKENFILTPTYHVFNMFKSHQGATAIKTAVEGQKIAFANPDNKRQEELEKLSVSASVKDGQLTLTVANLSLDEPEQLQLNPVGFQLKKDACITQLNAQDVRAHNDFDAPNAVEPTLISGSSDCIALPPATVATIVAELA
ncbi:MAG: alpha-L-arabinofuranosidase [Lentisphaerae bacterium]|jgi:alpha-N-arabinofuranosidase|nr:alpha-L-arabinofuranosidase [Lentisphaerota bacterium]